MATQCTNMDLVGTNALGIYSGMAKGGLDTASQKNLDSTWLRGLQKSDENGAVQFKTIFPGHY